ncbi:hypothetical protein PT974_00966 [Cladobotryum mycophilum]|uniref:Heterokaryon incompatibility domain-containing protein n=1 Tax=Cladobotryum mycophilum TaxID=491253 RepID=A0ABR0T3J4_9HYPO
MDSSWVEVIDLWEDSNVYLEKKRQVATESFLKSIISPGPDETRAIEEKKDKSRTCSKNSHIFGPKLDTAGALQIPVFDPDVTLFLDTNGESLESPRTCDNTHLYDFHPRDWREELRGHEYNFREEEEHKRKYQWTLGNSTFLDLVQTLCIQSRLRVCRWPRCRAQMERLQKAMPVCEKWKSFREWALTAGSCQLAAAGAGYQWLEDFSVLQIDNLVDLKKADGLPGDAVMILDVAKIAYFLLTQVQAPCSIIPNGYLRLIKSEPRSWFWYSGTTPASNVTRRPTSNGQGIKAANLSEKGQDDLLSLMELAEESSAHEQFEHVRHEACSAEFCQFDDENSARKAQLHKCANRDCRQLTFSMDQLNDAAHQGRTTAWPTRDTNSDTISLSPPPTGVMAISHVWSDGTGVGISSPGNVNSCLWSYFKTLADKLGCDGICKMQENYSSAKHTLIHDEYLLQFDWADDGSPALALVLSPWFTRGWTALELSVSKSIKVVYRDPKDHSRQFIKDLDDDILASRDFEKLGHIVASTIIRRLRNNEPSISDLLMIMRTRVTSWARDRITIASLLARVPDYDYEDSPATKTIKIMGLYLEVPLKFLLHGHETASPSGGAFSWCPSNLLDSSPATIYDLPSTITHTGVALVDRYGAAISQWQCRPVTAEDKTALKPYALHLSVEFRIRQALEEKWQHCLLIYNDSTGIDQPLSVLVATAGIC